MSILKLSLYVCVCAHAHTFKYFYGETVKIFNSYLPTKKMI